MIHRESFQRDYEHFWSLSPVDRPTTDGDLIALTFVMLAMGTQFVALPSPDEKEQTAEFYGKVAVPENLLRIAHSLQSLGSSSGSQSLLLSRSPFVPLNSDYDPYRVFPDE